MSNKIVIIDAGIIDSAIALQNYGHEMLLIDPNSSCAGASFGNPHARLSIPPVYFHKTIP